MDLGRTGFLINANMKYGAGEFENLPAYVNDIGFFNIAVVVDSNVSKNEYVKKVLAACSGTFKKCEILVYTLEGEPTYDYLDECSARMRACTGLDVIVGVGGGSAIDLAKGLAVLMTNKGRGLDYRGFPKGINRPLPVVAVPTTAGTGSEATYNAVFTDTKAQKKLGINTTMNFPILSILDPRLISTCPKEVIASSGMDAVTHAIESFVSRKATVLSRMFSIEALKLLFPNLDKVLDFPNDLDIKGNLQVGAYLAAIALINSSSGPAGALSYLLGTWYKVSHGIAGAVFLPHIHKFNLENEYHDYHIIYDVIKPNDKKSDREKAGDIIEKLFFLNKKLGIKEHLTSYGVRKEDLVKFEQEAVTTFKGAFDFNPVHFNEGDIKALFCRIMQEEGA